MIRLDALFLANSAEAQSGLLYVLGGAWSRCWPPPGQQYPYERNLTVAAVIRVPWTETNIQHWFRIAVLDDDGHELGTMEGDFTTGRAVDVTVGASQVVALAAQVTVTLYGPGIYHVVADLDDMEAHRIEFEALAARPTA